MTHPLTLPRQAFHKAQASQADNECVEVARLDDRVIIRNSRTVFRGPDDTWLIVPAADFDAYQDAIRNSFPTGALNLTITTAGPDTHIMRLTGTVDILIYTSREIAAFHDGVRHHEFDRATAHA